MNWTESIGKRILAICIYFFLIYFALLHFALPIWIELIITIFFILILKSIKQSFFFSLILVLFATGVSFILGSYGSDKIFYREHEKWSDKSGKKYMSNVFDVIEMNGGDLYALGKNSTEGNFDSLKEQRKVLFRTDQFGFRNDRQLKDAQLILVGDSFIVANGTDQSELPSVWLEKMSRLKVANVAYEGDPSSYERNLRDVLTEINLDASFVIFYFEGNDFVNFSERKERNSINHLQKVEYFDFNIKRIYKSLEKKYLQLEKKKDIYLSHLYPKDQTFFRVIRRVSHHLNNEIFGYFRKTLSIDAAEIKTVVVRSIGSYEMGFYKSYIDVTKSERSQTYIFKDKNIIKRIKAVFFIPTKWRVYSNFVNGGGGGENKLSNTSFNLLKSEYLALGIPVYDLTNALEIKAQKLLPINKYVFWRDDTHWNSLGVEAAMEEVVLRLGLN